MYFSLLLIFVLPITEVNPESSHRKPKLERVVPGTNKWPLTKFFASFCCHMNTTIKVGVSIQESDGGWKYIGGARKEPSKPHWITNLNGPKYQITTDGYFEIQNTTRVDDGSIYKFNVVGLDAHNEPVLIKLVYSPPELKEPIITEHSSTPAIVTENETITLRCKSSGNPRPKIIWTKDGNDSVLHEGVNYTLKNTTRKQAGIYLCIAQNGIGRNANASLRVTVNYPPSIEIGPNNQTALEGSDIYFLCIATGSPMPVMTWSKDNDQTVLHQGGIFLLPKVQTQAEGVYKCTAQNGIGKPLSYTATLVVKSCDMTTTAKTDCSIFKTLALTFGVLFLIAVFALIIIIIIGFLWYKRLNPSHYYPGTKDDGYLHYYPGTKDDGYENPVVLKDGHGLNAKPTGLSGVQESVTTVIHDSLG